MKQPKISIIVPVYNVEKYLKQCLDSIVNQTYKNLEIIIVNDGTKDNSMKIVEGYLSDSRVKVINKENGGLSSARNRGIEEATGDYISFVDSDDYIDINMYKRLINICKDEEVIIFNHSRFDDITEEVVKKRYTNENKMKELEEKMEYLYSNIENSCWNKIYKSSFIKENRFKFMEILYEDVCWNIEVFYQAKKVKILNESLYFYRINRKNSIMEKSKGKDEVFLEFQKKSYKKIFERLDFLIEKLKKDNRTGKIIYLISERENWRAKLTGEVYFIELDIYLKNYFKEQSQNNLEKKILIKKLNETLKSKNVKNIIGLNLKNISYWREGIFNFDFLRKRLKVKIQKIGEKKCKK